MLTMIAYWPIKNCAFINYDDPAHVYENIYVQQGLTWNSIKWAFSDDCLSFVSHWHPITWLSFMLDYEIFGMNPRGYHLTNLLLHIFNSILIFLIFSHITKTVWQSASVAVLFAIHPMHVESVAWITERRDVLSTLFWMITTGTYILYTEHKTLIRYLLMTALFIIGFMSKSMLVTLPFALVLLDYWPLGRLRLDAPAITRWRSIRSCIWEKLPLFALSVIFTILTYILGQKAGTIANTSLIPLTKRIENAIISLSIYMEKMVWPQKMAIFYPYPKEFQLWQFFGGIIVFAGISIIVLRMWKKLPYNFVGWFWYLGTILPVIGIVQNGSQAYADRYTYVPYIGLFIMISWTIPLVTKNLSYRRTILIAGAAVIITIFTIITRVQVGYWKNSEVLMTHAIEVTENNYIAHNSLGNALIKQGYSEEAYAHFMEAAQINPHYAPVQNNIGNVLYHLGWHEESIEYYFNALRIDPKDAEAHNNLGVALMSMGRLDEAENHLTEAVRIRPYYTSARFNLALILFNKGNMTLAAEQLKYALRYKPNLYQAHYLLGKIAFNEGRYGDAVKHFQDTLRLNPDFEAANNDIRNALAMQGKKQ